MAEIPLGIPRLLHRAEHQERDRALLGFAVQLLEQPLEMPRPHGARRRRQRVAEPAEMNSSNSSTFSTSGCSWIR